MDGHGTTTVYVHQSSGHMGRYSQKEHIDMILVIVGEFDPS